ncbi:MAG: HAMP domain-containing histidine kinase, partial [Clostridia bacterium]|nr:HAMP domain-containing histidine kinase [Clostridia bacterium]
GQEGKGNLVVRYPVTHIAESVRQIELYVLLVMAGALVIAFFISYSLANKLSGPVRNISGTAKKLAAGDYSVQFNSVEYAEIAQLSDTLNYMKDEIKKSDDFQKELLANVTHDLKTPLTMIKAYASMIKEISGNDPQKREKHLDVIIDEADRLTGLVNDILSTSKISAGLEQLNKKVFNLTELLYGVINKFSYLQETQGYSIMVDVEPNLYTLADEEQVHQVIYNLISNAINYTGEDKTIYVTLKTEAAENRIKFAVRDTGKGIAEDELSHIWDRYYRSKDSHTRPVKGTGLGLNIVKIILQKHGFDFGVNTKAGEGSTFYVDFPIS